MGAHGAETITGEPLEGGALHYVVVWVVLLALTALTYGLSRLELGAFALLVALAIAVLKTSLVAVFFMHFLHERGMSRLSIVIALLFVGSLALLAVADVATRFPLAVLREAGAPQAPRPVFAPPGERVTPF